MPKSITATSLNVERLVFSTVGGTIDGLVASVNVAYGEIRVREEFDLWAELTAGQRSSFQALYDRLAERLQATYLA